MARVVRLKSQDQREWNRNQSILMSEAGVVVRPVSALEQQTMFQLSRHVAQTKQPAKTKTPGEASMVDARLDKLPGSNAMAIRFFIDNHSVVGGREYFKQRMLALHGECQLRSLNGKFLCAVRDPRAQRAVAEKIARKSPEASSCMCQAWPLSDGSAHPTTHHPVCQFNDGAPPEERGTFKEPSALPAPAQVASPPAAVVEPAKPEAVVIPAVAVPAPEACHCKGWAQPDGSVKPDNVHHKMCEFRESWESANQAKHVIIDLDSGIVMRDATLDEVKEAEENEKTSGTMTLTIGDKMYGVILESETQTVEVNVDDMEDLAGPPA
jgi:hypothetical protein